jgi:hypothetical protein
MNARYFSGWNLMLVSPPQWKANMRIARLSIRARRCLGIFNPVLSMTEDALSRGKP